MGMQSLREIFCSSKRFNINKLQWKKRTAIK